MKLSASAFLFALCTIISCSKSSKQDPAVDLKLNKSSLAFTSQHLTDSVTVQASTSWSISGIPDWITVTPKSGTATTLVQITCQPNNSNVSRQANLSVDASGQSSVILQVNQAVPEPKILSITPHARGGSIIFIKGYGFSTTATENKVTINYYNATIEVARDSLLSVVVPELCGSGPITVTTNGQMKTADSTFIYDWIGTITTIVGGTQGYLDDFGTNAQFDHPAGITFDGNGKMYVADRGNNKVRKVIGPGVTTMPGRIAPLSNPTGPLSDFESPQGIVADYYGNVYVSETSANAITKISNTGVVSLLAGGNPDGFADGQGTAASFNHPMGIAMTMYNYVYVADAGNNKIRLINESGYVYTNSGSTAGYADGSTSAARYNNPVSIAIAGGSYLYIADKMNNRIRNSTSDGNVETYGGNGDPGFLDGQKMLANIYQPTCVVYDGAGNLFFADSNNNIRWIPLNGDLRTIQTNHAFDGVQGMAFGPNGGLYISDTNHNRICLLEFQ